MRNAICLALFLICLGLNAQGPTNIIISENFDQTPLTKVIRLLKTKYQLKLAYDDALISGITITGNYNDKTLEVFLTEALSEKGIDYQTLNGKIILTPKKVSVNVDTPRLFNLTVFGIVQDSITGEALPNAIIRVHGSNRVAITNKDGYFSLPMVPTDTSTLYASYLGYESHKLKLIPGLSKQTLRVRMEEAPLKLADFEVVKNNHKTISYGEDVSQITINQKNLAVLPSLGEMDVFRSLQLLPGISGTNETSSNLNIRSSPSSDNLILFDGFTIYRLDHFFGVFSAINADAIRDIQIYKGGFGAKYGGRVSGVVDMTGSTGNFNEPSYSLGINLMSARMSVNAPLNGGQGAFHISARRAYTDIIRSNLFESLYKNYRTQSGQIGNQQNPIDTDDVLRPDFHFYDMNVKATYEVSQRDIVNVSFYNGRDDLDTDFNVLQFSDNDPSQIEMADSYIEKAEWGNDGLGFTWSRSWNTNYYSSLQVAHSRHFFNYFYEYQSKDDSGEQVGLYRLLRRNAIKDLQINYRNELTLGKRHSLDFGLNVSDLTVENKRIIEDLNTVSGSENPTEKGSVISFYLEDEYAITDKLTLNLGGRYNTTALTNENYFSPRYGLRYQLSPSVQLKASGGKYYQFIQDVTFNDPLSDSREGWHLAGTNTDRPVLNAAHYILGFKYEKNNWLADIELYKKNVKGINETNISHIYDPAEDTRKAIVDEISGSGKIKGIDLLIQKTAAWYQGWVAYTYSKAYNTFEQVNRGNEIPSRQDQRHEFKFVNILESDRWNFSTTWIYGSGLPFYQPEISLVRNNQGEVINYNIDNNTRTIERLPNYHRLDVSIALKFQNQHMKGEVGLSLLNVYNRLNVQSRRLNEGELEELIGQGANATLPENLYRDLTLLDFTPSVFLNLNF
ncbi:TonB-dependent receptor domain-containing protein [Roseivirga pacifica]|uniref:TonB-dependent receptor domain-containing protein n=1 Tax=Roseivirga pacifica TaxID=1267423 RepID=UPI00209557EA|nr:TonB-dependent receptor [Roseivirga pacifica]MCO6358331.1 TonB-dependent receptor plug domain-containing protein [Roseivirga pacifica]MCO6366205.1 TonB-dependent receptor plug domain-containing protein [Roseivirga pacifica]MCO6369244.1 TonB-dependent receptor plug domain-containing protein [Roseivirga pacifica]MCO6374062.1 TonB-dependent receptor plug domain-containing protein [Roseivirga pacifica]MCO6378438.1 TonB-dependent receptor plug domain-containing protein [Roseivirga pacifica]